MDKAKDLVPGGAPDQLKGREIFFPPAPGITYCWGIFPLSGNALEVSCMAGPPEVMAGVIKRMVATTHQNRLLVIG
jgi:hypothetical protein